MLNDAYPEDTFQGLKPVARSCGPGSPVILFKFNLLDIYHEQMKLLGNFTKEKFFEFYYEIRLTEEMCGKMSSVIAITDGSFSMLILFRVQLYSVK